MLVDVHQHIWTASLLERLAARDRLPMVRRVDWESALELIDAHLQGVASLSGEFAAWGLAGIGAPA